MDASVLVILAGVLLLAATFIYANRDASGTKEIAAQIATLRGDLKAYALKSDVDGVRNIAADASARTVMVADECKSIVDSRVKNIETDISILKGLQKDNEKKIAVAHAAQAKVIHATHTHTYSSPFPVDVMHENVKTKGRGQKSLMERVGQ